MELEYQLLGLEREDDVPGHLIPDLYFRFIRTGDATRIHHVFHHNRHDILSLAALSVCAADLLDEDYVPDDPVDDVSLGRLFERSGEPERSMLHYARAVEAGVTGPARRRALKALADQHKRRGDLDAACELWRELEEDDSAESIGALHELAMVAEHRDRHYAEGVELCERALTRLEDNYDLPLTFRAKWREAFTHRRRRLERRLRRHRRAEPMATVTVELREGTVATIRARQFTWRADEPPAARGTDTGPTPYEMLLGSLAGCIAITLRLYADHKGMGLTGVDVALEFDRVHADDCEDCDERADGYIERIQSHVTLHGSFDDAQRIRLTQVAQRCPVHKTLANGVHVTDTVEFS